MSPAATSCTTTLRLIVMDHRQCQAVAWQVNHARQLLPGAAQPAAMVQVALTAQHCGARLTSAPDTVHLNPSPA